MKILLIVSNVLSGITAVIALAGCMVLPTELKIHSVYMLFGCISVIIYNCMFLNWITTVENNIERLSNKLVNLSNRIDRRLYSQADTPTQKRLIIKSKQMPQNLNAPLDSIRIPATYRLECPKCNNMLSVYDDDIIVYCNKCGQKIQIN